MARSFVARWFRRLFLAGLGLFGLALVGLLVLYAIVAPRLPDVAELRNVELQMPLSVYSRDGRLIAIIGETRRTPVSIEQVPAQVRNAVIAIEDARFYQHHGVDWRGVGRAVWLLLTTSDERVPGGSTITQQVARNFYLSAEYSYTRKFEEMLLAIKMEQELSKDEILELYLNKIFFGNRAYGIVAAADYYYGKTLDQLTLAEAAMLAGVPKFPSSANPLANPERALTRRNYILQRMQENGFITVEQMRAAQAEPDRAAPHEPRIELDAPYVAEMVRQAMVERYGEAATTDGFRVTTTLDSADQLAAERSVRRGLVEYDRRHGWRGAEAHVDLPANADDAAMRLALRQAVRDLSSFPAAIVARVDGGQARLLTQREELRLDAEDVRWTGRALAQLLQRGDIVRLLPGDQPGDYGLAQLPQAQSALVSLEPETGSLRALVGGFSYVLNKFNRATQAYRQPGSSFKPFVYAAAFERGYSPSSIVLDAPVVFRDRRGRVWAPQNDAGGFAGPMRLREAMVQSRNLVSVRLLDAIGVDYARRMIVNFGFDLDRLPPNLSMSLGTASLTPLSVARGYAAFANGGFRITPYFIERVEDRHGVVVLQAHPERACALCPQRLQTEARASHVVDGFDFTPGGPTATPAPAPAAPEGEPAPVAAATPAAPPEPAMDPELSGPPTLNLAPRAIDGRSAFMVRSMMYDVVLRGTATAARRLERADVGGKTGSTNDHRDAWFAGVGGDLVTVVWVGRDGFESLGRGEYGGRAALPIWINYMESALDGVPLADMSPPPNTVVAWVNAGGQIVPEGTPGAIREFFKAEEYERAASEGFSLEVPYNESQEAFDIF
jgi:penicillin-binding protein 1A